MSLRLNFCWSVPPEFLRSFLNKFCSQWQKVDIPGSATRALVGDNDSRSSLWFEQARSIYNSKSMFHSILQKIRAKCTNVVSCWLDTLSSGDLIIVTRCPRWLGVVISFFGKHPILILWRSSDPQNFRIGTQSGPRPIGERAWSLTSDLPKLPKLWSWPRNIVCCGAEGCAGAYAAVGGADVLRVRGVVEPLPSSGLVRCLHLAILGWHSERAAAVWLQYEGRCGLRAYPPSTRIRMSGGGQRPLQNCKPAPPRHQCHHEHFLICFVQKLSTHILACFANFLRVVAKKWNFAAPRWRGLRRT